jgi:patatin-like phospholipase/acyl hydrolase
MGTYRILAFDGGGIRGVYTAVLLRELEKQVPGFLGRADLVAGTSTGGILALALAKGLTADELVKLYQDNGKQIFARSLFRQIGDLGDLIGAKYDNANLEKILREVFGDLTMDNLLPRHVLISSFDLDYPASPGMLRAWKPKFFHNFAGDDSDGSEKVVDVALRTSAAPTYFPVFQGYVDGGVVANNPAMAALAQALDDDTGNQEQDDIRLFSVGTGVSPTFISGDSHNWGVAQWAHPLVNMMIEGMMGVADYECSRVLREKYFRLAPNLPAPVAMDAVDKIPDLIADASKVDLTGSVSWLKTNFV